MAIKARAIKNDKLMALIGNLIAILTMKRPLLDPRGPIGFLLGNPKLCTCTTLLLQQVSQASWTARFAFLVMDCKPSFVRSCGTCTHVPEKQETRRNRHIESECVCGEILKNVSFCLTDAVTKRFVKVQQMNRILIVDYSSSQKTSTCHTFCSEIA